MQKGSDVIQKYCRIMKKRKKNKQTKNLEVQKYKYKQHSGNKPKYNEKLNGKNNGILQS